MREAEQPSTIRMNRGILVAFEGIDGAGKTTQALRLKERLEAAGLETVLSKEPTSGPHGTRIRQSAMTGRLEATDELRILLDDRRQHVAELIVPSIEAGKVVIIDRYYFSTAAYQGARGFDPDSLLALNEDFAPAPDLLVLLDISVDTALERIRLRGDGNGNLFERKDTLETCAEIFGRLERPFLLRLDGTQAPDQIHQRIVAALDVGPLFRNICHKTYLTACEPADCSYRIQHQCDYPYLGVLREPPSVRAETLNAIASDSNRN